MATRLTAGGLIVVSVAVAWLAITFGPAARALQLAIAISVVYVAWLAWRGARAIRASLRGSAEAPPTDAPDLPFVSIVVPARNEAAVIARSVAGLAALRYGAPEAPRYEVVVVDDGSSDGTDAAARAAAGDAPHLRVIRRPPGSGPATKAGVLAFAEPELRGEVVAVVDADSRVPDDMLARAMRAWRRDPTAAAIQPRRVPFNLDGWLMRAQAEEQLIDLASQSGRHAADGTAELRGNGMLVRRDALAAVGGWPVHALTEDLDLSTRLAAAGEHVAVAADAMIGEEAVTTLSALWRQRFRWAEGSLRRLLQHGPGLVGGELSFRRKLDFLVFTAEFLLPPLFLATTAASLLTIPLPQPADWTVPLSLFIGYGSGTFLLGLAGLGATGARGPRLVLGALRGALFLSHWLLVVPAALARIALVARPSAFEPTPRAVPGPAR